MINVFVYYSEPMNGQTGNRIAGAFDKCRDYFRLKQIFLRYTDCSLSDKR